MKKIIYKLLHFDFLFRKLFLLYDITLIILFNYLLTEICNFKKEKYKSRSMKVATCIAMYQFHSIFGFVPERLP